MAQNPGPAPIFLHLNLTSDDAVIEPSNLIVKVIKPSETIAVASIHSKIPGQRYRVSSSFKFSIGDPDALPAPSASY